MFKYKVMICTLIEIVKIIKYIEAGEFYLCSLYNKLADQNTFRFTFFNQASKQRNK